MELVREINDNPIKNPMDVNKYLEEFKMRTENILS